MKVITGWKKIYHANSNQKRAGVAIVISEKIEFKTKIVTGKKERTFYNHKSKRCSNYKQGPTAEPQAT